MRGALVIGVGCAALVAGCGPSDPLQDVRGSLEAAEPTDGGIVRLSRDAAVVEATRRLFTAHCAMCHAVSGTGLVGPNLTDDAYLAIERPVDFYETIAYGRHAEGMPAWNTKLDEAEMLALAAYAAALRGSAPEGEGKDPEGEPAPPWETFLNGERSDAGGIE